MDENPYKAPQGKVGSDRAPLLPAMVRDLVIVAIFIGILAALTAAYVYLAHHVWRGMASIPITLLHAILMLICTIIGGALVNRIWLGLLGIILFWSAWVAFDTVTTEAPFRNILLSSLIPFGVQSAVVTAVWRIASSGSVPGVGGGPLECGDGGEPV
jgi:hypothetical protein